MRSKKCPNNEYHMGIHDKSGTRTCTHGTSPFNLAHMYIVNHHINKTYWMQAPHMLFYIVLEDAITFPCTSPRTTC